MKVLYVGIDNLSCNGVFYILNQWFCEDSVLFANIEHADCEHINNDHDIIIIDCEAIMPYLDVVKRMFSSISVPLLILANEVQLMAALQRALPTMKGMINRNVNAEFLVKSVELIIGGGYCYSWNTFIANTSSAGAYADELYEKAGLTRREKEILRFCLAGETNKSISHKLSRSEKTISSHKSNIFKKLGIKSWQLRDQTSKFLEHS